MPAPTLELCGGSPRFGLLQAFARMHAAGGETGGFRALGRDADSAMVVRPKQPFGVHRRCAAAH